MINQAPSRSWRSLALLLALAHFAAFADRALTSVYAPALRHTFGLSDAAVGLLHGPAFVVLYCLGLLVIGNGMLRGRSQTLVIGGLLLWTSASVVFALAPNYPTLIASRIMLGMGQAFFVPTALALLMAATPDDRRGEATSWFTTGSSTGRSGALLLGGAALAGIAALGLAEDQGWRIAVLLLTAPNLVLAALLLPRVGRVAHEPHRLGALSPAVAAVLRDPLGLGLHFLAGAAVILLVQAGAAWVPSVVNRQLAVEPAEAALLVGAVVLAAAPIGHLTAGRWMSGPVGSRRPPTGAVLVGVALATLGVLLLGLSTHRAPALVGLGLLTAGGGGAALALLAGLAKIAPAARRTATLSMFLAWVSLVGVGCGPVLTGLISDAVDRGGGGLSQALIWVVTTAALIAALLAIAGRRGWMRAAAGVND